MEFKRTLTATVYIVNEKKVLLHRHKKYNSLFAVGGHIESHELPHEAAIREAFEEAGLNITLYCDEDYMYLGKVQQVPKPVSLLVENVGHERENLDFIYFATATTDTVAPQDGESREIYWLTKEEVMINEDIKPHIKSMALKALDTIIE